MTTGLLVRNERTMLARPLKLGFLGVGWIGRNRMEALAHEDGIEIAAIADPSPHILSEATQFAPASYQAADLDDLLQMKLDGIVIATPSALHAEQSIAALNDGAAVFCQKPLGRNAREARSVVDAARAADRLLGLDLSYRHCAAVRAMRERIQSGRLGEIHAVDLVFHNAYGPDKAWFYDLALAGGGCVIDLGVHLVDLALWLLDFPKVVATTSALFAKGRRITRAWPG